LAASVKAEADNFLVSLFVVCSLDLLSHRLHLILARKGVPKSGVLIVRPLVRSVPVDFEIAARLSNRNHSIPNQRRSLKLELPTKRPSSRNSSSRNGVNIFGI
jgi:hypothetical protein